MNTKATKQLGRCIIYFQKKKKKTEKERKRKTEVGEKNK